jgi:UDP-N-acetylglucosamine 2-epimerase (non-hydrolysing)
VKVLHVVGTRPNFMKVAPVMRALAPSCGVEQVLVHTGQHHDAEMSDAFFEDLAMPIPHHYLGVGSGTHAEQTARAMLRIEPILLDERPAVVVVPGDGNSTLAAALAAAQAGIPVAHLEAGLRSRDPAMPEERNRTLTDHLGELLLTPSPDANQNLLDEGIDPHRIVFVGNTMIDSLRAYEPAARRLDVAVELEVEDFVLVTLHRPGLVDHPDRFTPVMDALEQVAEVRPVVYPIHPRSRQCLQRARWRPRRVRLIEPLGYLRFLSLMCAADLVLTDSGGVQEETTALGVPCFTLRANTERPITVGLGTNTVLGVGDAVVSSLPERLNGVPRGQPVEPELWDGRAAERVRDAILARFPR